MSNTSDASKLSYRCDPGGVYSDCYYDFSTSDESLAKLEYPRDFIGEARSSQSGSLATRFCRPSDPSVELRFCLFGEMLDEREGTGFGAMGGSSLKRDEVTCSTL